MRALLALALLGCSSHASAPRAPNTSFTARVSVRGANCGGADDGDRPDGPVGGLRLDVTAGATYAGAAPVLQVVTDENGRFTASLPPGRYCVVHTGRGPRPSEPCAARLWEQCEARIDAPAASEVTLELDVPCALRSCSPTHAKPP